jgi:methyltransferase-like protein
LVEQYLDFVVNRTFRQSLLVHAERAAQIRYQPDRSRFAHMHFAAWAPPVDGPTVMDHSRQEYQQGEDSTLFTNDPGIKAALDALSARWPWTLSRQELVDEVHARLVSAGLRPAAELSEVVDNLVQLLIFQGQASFRLDPVLPERAAGPLRLDEPTRRMAELTGAASGPATFTRWHETVPLTPLDRHLLPLLDGTRDRDALVDGLLAAVLSESSAAEPDGTPAPDEAELRDGVAEYVDAAPQRLAELKLFRVDG